MEVQTLNGLQQICTNKLMRCFSRQILITRMQMKNKECTKIEMVRLRKLLNSKEIMGMTIAKIF